MKKAKKSILVLSLGTIASVTIIPTIALASTSCSASDTFDTSKFSLSKYNKYIETDNNGEKCLMIPNGTINVNIDLIMQNEGDVSPFNAIVIPDSVTNISVKLGSLGRNSNFILDNFYYGNDVNHKSIYSNNDQIEKFSFNADSRTKITGTHLNLPTNIKESYSSSFSLIANHASFCPGCELDFSNYQNVRNFTLIFKESNFSYDYSNEIKLGTIKLPSKFDKIGEGQFNIDFSDSMFITNIVLPDYMPKIGKNCFGHKEGNSYVGSTYAGNIIFPASWNKIPNNYLSYILFNGHPFTVSFESWEVFKNSAALINTKSTFLPIRGNSHDDLCLDLSKIPVENWTSTNPYDVQTKKAILEYLTNESISPFGRWKEPGNDDLLDYGDAINQLNELNSIHS